MAWLIYRSSDPGAPVLTGQAGSAIALLDAVLVNGYGSKAAAGWTKAFSGTNKAAYRSGATATARMYLRVDDAGSFGAGTREAAMRGFMSMSDVDTGTDPFPAVAQSTNGLQIGKSQTADATARDWVIAADYRTVIILVNVGNWQAHYIGEIDTFVSGDAYHAMLIAPEVGSNPDGFATSVLPALAWPASGNTGLPAIGGHFIARSYSQTGTSENLGKIGDSNVIRQYDIFADGGSSAGWGWLPRVNPADGAVYLSDFLVGGSGFHLRGRLRGIFAMGHLAGTWASGEQFAGGGEFAGKFFEVFVQTVYQTYIGSPYAVPLLTALEISDTAT